MGITGGSGKRTNRPTRRNASRGTPPDAEPLVSRGTPADEAQLGASGRSRQLGAALLDQANEECAGAAHSASVPGTEALLPPLTTGRRLRPRGMNSSCAWAIRARISDYASARFMGLPP